MPRPTQRACLQDGIKLDLSSLTRRGYLARGGRTTQARITWTSSYWGVVARGFMSALMDGDRAGWFTIQLEGGRAEHVHLVAEPRHFGGVQWYFVCPRTGRRCTVLWRPNGASLFACRQNWGPRRVAYRSQFLDRDNRAHHAQSKIKNRLCEIGGLDPDDWDLPPKPKWMRWRTYERIEAEYDGQDDILNEGMMRAMARYEALK